MAFRTSNPSGTLIFNVPNTVIYGDFEKTTTEKKFFDRLPIPPNSVSTRSEDTVGPFSRTLKKNREFRNFVVFRGRAIRRIRKSLKNSKIPRIPRKTLRHVLDLTHKDLRLHSCTVTHQGGPHRGAKSVPEEPLRNGSAPLPFSVTF